MAVDKHVSLVRSGQRLKKALVEAAGKFGSIAAQCPLPDMYAHQDRF